jgi:ribonuclease HI
VADARKASKLACRTAVSAIARRAFDCRFQRDGFAAVRILLGKSNDRAEPDCSPDDLNLHFAEKVAKLASDALVRCPVLPPVMPVGPVFPFSWTAPDASAVKAVLAGVSPSLAMGADEVPMFVLKLADPWIVDWLVVFVARMLAVGVWPDAWKLAVLIPIWKKKGRASCLKEYRPIALLSALSRVVEKILAVPLQKHLDAHVLPSSHHGSRRFCSPRTAIASLLHYIAVARDKHELVAVLSLDIQGAFDTVNHDRLVEKAVVLAGLSQSSAALLRHYLSGRRQRVRMRAGESDILCTSVGVPQGSVLGPHLFSLYTSDLPHSLSCATLIAYVDDFTLVVSDVSFHVLESKLRRTVHEVETYCASNALLLAEKSQLLLVGTNQALTVTIRGVDVPASDTIHVLKVAIDKRLTFLPQAMRIAAAVTAVARCVAEAFRYLKPIERAHLMRTLAHPRLDYIWPVLVGANSEASNIVERSYTRTARFSITTRRIDHRPGGPSAVALSLFRWPSWGARLTAIRNAFAMRVWETGMPLSLRAMLPSASAVGLGATLRLQHRLELPMPHHPSRVGSMSFAYWGVQAINDVRCSSPPCVDLDGQLVPLDPMPRYPFRPDPPDVLAYYSVLRCRFRDNRELSNDGRILVWTDGSAFQRECAGRMGRRAGAGIFYGAGNPRNAAVPVTGVRTAQRAELVAFLHILRSDDRPVEVRTDSRYLVDGVACLTDRRQRAWYRKPTLAEWMPNADVWFEIDWRLDRRTPDSVSVVKIKGHASEATVSAGTVSELDVWGNAGADWVAQWAARFCSGQVERADGAWLDDGH